MKKMFDRMRRLIREMFADRDEPYGASTGTQVQMMHVLPSAR